MSKLHKRTVLKMVALSAVSVATLALVSKGSFAEAARIANIAAGIVVMKPGATQLAVTPRLAYSAATDFIMPIMPALLAA